MCSTIMFSLGYKQVFNLFERVLLQQCQKICKTLKKLSNELLPYSEVVRVITTLLEEREDRGEDIRVFEHVISYAFQFGDRVPGKSYRERGNSNRIDNWALDMNIIYQIYLRLYNICIDNNDQFKS
jgi:hypothetical protein